MLVSKDNKRIKNIRQLLNSKKRRREEGLFVIEGKKPVDEAVRCGLVEEIYVSEGYDGDAPEGAEIVGEKLFKEITDTVTPQGIMAVVRFPEFDKNEIYNREACRVICLEDVRDPGNVGTIVRTAEAAGFDAVVMSGECADVYQPKVVRSTMGSILRVPCIECEGGFVDELNLLKQKGFTLYAAHLEGAVDYREPEYAGRTAILIGNEAKGLTAVATDSADVAVKIPMQGEVESLNASIAAALLMYGCSN